MTIIVRRLQVVFLFLFFITGVNKQLFAQKQSVLSEEQRQNFDKCYYNGAREKVAQNKDEAIKQFKTCILIDPYSDPVYYNLAELYMEKKQFRDAQEYIQKAIELNKENLWYKKLQVDIYERTGEFEKAAELSYYMSTKEDEIPNLIQAAFFYEQAKLFPKAIKMLELAEKKTGVNEDIVIKKEQLYLAQNKFELAVKEIKKLCTAFPDNMKYQVLLAELYLVNGKEKEGVALYLKILEKDPSNGYAAFALGDYYHLQNENEKWFSYMKIGLASRDVDVKSKLRMMVVFMTSKSFSDTYQRSQELIDIFIQTHPTEPSVYLVKGDLFIEQAKFLEAHTEFEKAITIEPSILVAYQQMIFCSSKLADNKLLQKDCELAIENFPNEIGFHIYLTIANLQLKEYEKAVSSAIAGLNVANGDKEVMIQFYVNLGDAYHYLNKHSACDSAYENALKLDSLNAYALNNYAYFLSLRKIKLDKAEAMSKKSLEIDPANASYADTYGWICYQRGEFEKAKEYIQKSLAIEPENSEVIDHLGDVWFKLGDKGKAMDNWKNAKEKGRVNDILEQKLKSGNLYE